MNLTAVILALTLQLAAEHRHPLILPAPEAIWSRCCQQQDCVEAEVSVMRIRGGYLVFVADFPAVRIAAEKIYRSENGRSYICTSNGELPPTEENIYCAFIVDEYV